MDCRQQLTHAGLTLFLTLLAGCVSSPAELPGQIPAQAAHPVQPTDRALVMARALGDSALGQQLQACAAGPFAASDFSISHRGAPFGYPEHTEEGYLAAARMGAGAIECDVTFTADHQLVCRHSQCDLHTTTNILQTALAQKCSVPFAPANGEQPATAKCCTSDITLAEYKTLCGRRDIVNTAADSVEDYLSIPAEITARSAPWVVSPVQCGTLLSHDESITLFQSLGVRFIPELKAPMVAMPHHGFSRYDYADAMLQAYAAAAIAPEQVFPQSFDLQDIKYWLARYPEFARQAVFLDPRGRQPGFAPTLQGMQQLKLAGINIVAPPMPMLLVQGDDGTLQASTYATMAAQAGLDIITWTFEAGDATAPGNWLYMNLRNYMTGEEKMLDVLHALHTEAGIKGIFSDWPGTVTYYANCLQLP